MADLNRSLSLGLLTLYGLGTTIGAGIFVLIGRVAGAGGELAPLSFVLAAVIAGLSAATFAEFATRFPESGGEAVYVKEGLGSDALALVVGLLVAGAGVISSATIVTGFAGYLTDLTGLPHAASLLGAVGLLALIVVAGIRVSVSVAALITIVEVGALLVVLAFGLPERFTAGTALFLTHLFEAPAAVWTGMVYGGFLAFYAFIGFEDIVNVAEETKDPGRTIPRAIFLTLAVTTVLYALVSVVALGSVAPDALAASPAPMTTLFERVSGLSGEGMSVIALVSVLNGALIQIIMASRLLYGLGRRGWLPAPFAYVNGTTRTPVVSALFCAAVIAGLGLLLDVERLAVATSLTTLAIFALVNLALIAVKRRAVAAPASFRTPVYVPAAALFCIGSLLLFQFFAGRA